MRRKHALLAVRAQRAAPTVLVPAAAATTFRRGLSDGLWVFGPGSGSIHARSISHKTRPRGDADVGNSMCHYGATIGAAVVLVVWSLVHATLGGHGSGTDMSRCCGS